MEEEKIIKVDNEEDAIKEWSNMKLVERVKFICMFFVCPRTLFEKYNIDKEWLVNKIISIPIIIVAWISRILGVFAIIIIIRNCELYDLSELFRAIFAVLLLVSTGSLLILSDEVWKREKDSNKRMAIISGVLAFIGIVLAFYSIID